jgi:hypothetical protein
VLPVLNQAPRNEDAWGTGDTAPHILNPGTRRRRVVSLQPRPRYPRGKPPPPAIHWTGGRTDTRAGLDAVAERKNFLTAPRGNRTPAVQLTEIDQLLSFSYSTLILHPKGSSVKYFGHLLVYDSLAVITYF